MNVVFVVLFVMLNGDISVSYKNYPTMEACKAAGREFAENLRAMTDEQMIKMGFKQTLAWCDDKIIAPASPVVPQDKAVIA